MRKEHKQQTNDLPRVFITKLKVKAGTRNAPEDGFKETVGLARSRHTHPAPEMDAPLAAVERIGVYWSVWRA
jgi:hypothetical protein